MLSIVTICILIFETVGVEVGPQMNLQTVMNLCQYVVSRFDGFDIFTKPYHDMHGFVIYLSDDADLFIAFVKVTLVDAKSIYPVEYFLLAEWCGDV